MYSTVSIVRYRWTVSRDFKKPSTTPHFTIELHPSVASLFYPQFNPSNTFQKYENSLHTLFFGFNKIHSFGQSVRTKSPLSKFTDHHMKHFSFLAPTSNYKNIKLHIRSSCDNKFYVLAI